MRQDWFTPSHRWFTLAVHNRVGMCVWNYSNPPLYKLDYSSFMHLIYWREVHYLLTKILFDVRLQIRLSYGNRCWFLCTRENLLLYICMYVYNRNSMLFVYFLTVFFFVQEKLLLFSLEIRNRMWQQRVAENLTVKFSYGSPQCNGSKRRKVNNIVHFLCQS